ncbi:hypothetical protein [Desulfosporosinus youngiae]|uniref:hypothetical protein n=1 Tax=Desulfosporosinus youngiae TaxID=339862 RepID=UPI0002DC1F47|nr:hypothetical protein [Desulfosporosinus youngiae]
MDKAALLAGLGILLHVLGAFFRLTVHAAATAPAEDERESAPGSGRCISLTLDTKKACDGLTVASEVKERSGDKKLKSETI